MTKRRSRGDGGLHWDENRQRWIATAHVGYNARGKRVTKKASGKTKTDAKDKLKEILRDLDDGLAVAPHGYTVNDAVEDWLRFGLSGKSVATVNKNAILARTHVISALGSRKLRDLTADDVDRWLAEKATTLSTSTLQNVRSVLSRAIGRAQARDKVKRNVVLLCQTPKGRIGRPSTALTLPQAEALLRSAEADQSVIGAYIVLSLLTGARTEELRALTWTHVDLSGDPDATPLVPPHVMVWRSVRDGGDTKTRRSRRTLALPQRCVAALTAHHARQRPAGRDGLVFASRAGTELDAANVRRGFRRVVAAAGLAAGDWTPRELRHSFVSLLSDARVPIEQIARLVGHNGTTVTELIYRHQLRPVLDEGATVMDRIFPANGPR